MRFADTYSSRPTRFHPSPPERKEEGTRDLALLRQLQAGEEQAFWSLWIKHSRRLLAVCLREMNGNRVDAEDALQEAMLRAYDKLPRFAAVITNPASWLIRMTCNVCKDVYRDRARRALTVERLKVLQSDRVQLPEVQQADRLFDDYDPAALAALLPDPLRRVFILRVLQHASYPEIAARLGLTCVTVRKRVQLSRAALRTWRNDHAA
jgi:RNA polymerase sigma factor (sigma-70 family)